MNEMVQRLIDQVFAGRDTVEKTELVNKGESMGLPGAISERLRQLPEGQVSRSQVEQQVGDTGDLGDLGDLRKAI